MGYRMFKIAVICCVSAVSAVGAAGAVVSLQQSRQASAAELSAPTPVAASATAGPSSAPTATTSSGNRDASIPKSADGHYWAQADVNGSAVRFLVDTGATAVSLSPEDARRLGFAPDSLTYSYKVMTAAGEARAAKVQLNSISVGGARIDGVDAYVIEKGLTQSLLGMSYLGRLSTFEATQSALILRS
jgi:aspartyl protease family protein